MGLVVNDGGVMTANSLTVDIDRSAVDYSDIFIDDFMSLHAANVQNGSSLTVYGAADVRITGNDGNDEDTTGLRVMNGSTVTLHEGGNIAAAGAYTENNGLVLDGDINNFVSDKAVNISATGESETNRGLYFINGDSTADLKAGGTITASDGYVENTGVMLTGDDSILKTGGRTEIYANGEAELNYGISAEGGSIEMAETFIEAKGGEYASALDVAAGGHATFTEDLTAKATEAIDAKAIRITGDDEVSRYVFNAGNISVTAEAEEDARGFDVVDYADVKLSGTLTANVSGGKESIGLRVANTTTFSALYGDVTVEGEEGVGLYIRNDGGETTFTDGAKINAATGMSLHRSTGTFGGTTQIKADKSKNGANTGIDSELASLTLKDAQSEAYGGRTARGLHVKGGTAEVTGELITVAQGATNENTGIKITNYDDAANGGKLTAAQNVVATVDGTSATGMEVNFNSSAEVKGHFQVHGSGDGQVNGLKVGEGSTFRGNTAYIETTGENSVGVYGWSGDSKITFDGNAYVKAAEGVKIENARGTFNGVTHIESKEGAGKAVSVLGQATASSATFKGDVVTDAAVTAEAKDETSEVIFEKGLVTLADDTAMTAADGAKISVNGAGAGTVQYTGTTDITGTASDGALDMTLNGAGSYWNLTGDSRATKLTNSGALLDMTADGGAFSTLTLADLGGENGTVRMDIDASKNAGNSDRIHVTNTFSGTQTVDLHRVDGNGEPAAAGTVIAKVNVNEGTFIANDTEGTLFYNRYTLDKQSTDEQGFTTEWYIKEIEQIGPEPEPEQEPEPDAPRETTTVNSVMSAASLNYHTWRTQNDKLMQRMGDLRKGGGANNGAWFRFGGSKISLGGGHGFDNEYMYYEVGYDRIIRETSQYTWFGGVAFSYGEGDSSYSRGDGDNESKAVSLYLTQINKGGSYLDLVFKLGRWDNDFAVYNTYGERITGETESTGISFSAEYGKKIALNKNGFYIEPQAQLTYGHLDGDTYTTSNGVSVHQEGIESLVGRVGFNLGWDISKTSNIYLKASVLHEFLGDYGVGMSDATGRVSLTGDYGDTWFEYGLGAAFKLGKPNSANFLYFDVERSEGGDLDMEWRWNAGFRFEM